jgi:cyclopropane fatty-acyl-phospholipid synthase-like methyltransferase
MSDILDPEVLPTKIFCALHSFERTEALRAAVELDVFTAISDQGSSADEIAARCKTSPRGMRVLCDHLCLTGLLQKRVGRYWLTEEAALYLDRRSDRFIADAAIQVYAGGVLAEGYRNLAQALRIGGTALPRAGTLAPDHPYWSQFARALAPVGAATARLLANRLEYPPTVPIRVLDVACGHGHYGIAIAKRNSLAEIFALDWPAVLELALANAHNAGVLERYHAVPGDVFSTNLGERYDLALITNFLPDLGSEDCVKLLARIRSALTLDGRAVALQAIPEDDRLSPPNAPSLALSLLVQTPHGDVYTYGELDEMFRRAGFVRTEMRELGPPHQRVVIAYH